MRSVLGLIAAIGSMALFGGVALSGLEHSFLYFPVRQVVGDPALVGLAYDEVALDTSDGVRLHGWFVPGSEPAVLIWFHGNAGNVGHRLETLRLLHDSVGASVLLFDYRGYGRSQGQPSESGLARDAQAALAYVAARPGAHGTTVVYFGQSLGASVAVDLATHHVPSALILEAPFPSVPYLARHHYPFLPVWPLLKNRFETQTKIRQLNVPLLVTHGDRDEVVPLSAGRLVFDAAPGPKEFYVIRGAGHNDTFQVGGHEYLAVLRHFITGVRP